MKHILDTLRDFVPVAQDNLLPDGEFYRYLEDNPVLYSLVSSAIREGNVTDGNILINHPACFDPKPGKGSVTTLIGDMLEKLRYFDRWLATASHKHGFTVFGITVKAARTPKQNPRAKRVTKTRAKRKVTTRVQPKRKAAAKVARATCDEIPTRQKLLKTFCKKVGGIVEAKRTIQSVYDAEGNQTKTARKLSRTYSMRILQTTLCSWMLFLNLKCKPQVGGRRIKIQKSNFKADQILRKKKKVSLKVYLRQSRNHHKTWREIAAQIEKVTGIHVHYTSIARLAHRARIR